MQKNGIKVTCRDTEAMTGGGLSQVPLSYCHCICPALSPPLYHISALTMYFLKIYINDIKK